jgi:hypothetical protein
MDNEKRTYRFGTEEICAPANLEPEQVRSMWADIMPGLENAEIETQSDGSINFCVRGGDKGIKV